MSENTAVRDMGYAADHVGDANSWLERVSSDVDDEDVLDIISEMREVCHRMENQMRTMTIILEAKCDE